MELELLTSLGGWLEDSALHSFIINSTHAWYVGEILHFIGLALLIGAVGILDLRILGVAKALPVGPLHQVVPWGIAGFVLCVLSGLMFVTGEPFTFLLRPAFQLKMLFVFLAGMNVLVFYLFMFRDVETLGPRDDAPARAKVVAGVSLSLWFSVIFLGRWLGVA